MSDLAAFAYGVAGAAVYQTLALSGKARGHRAEGKEVPHWLWLAATALPLVATAGGVTLLTLGHTGAPDFAALMTGIAWTALLPVTPPLPWPRQHGADPSERALEAASRPPATLARFLDWWTTARLQTLLTAVLALVAVLTYLSR